MISSFLTRNGMNLKRSAPLTSLIADVVVSLLGCEAPQLKRGRTGGDGWFREEFTNPVCHIVLRHPQVNNGRSFVYAVPKKPSAVTSRDFVFEVQAAEHLATDDFNVAMDVERDNLVWQRAGRTLHYTRQ